MGKLIVSEFVTLDGVVEAPGGEQTHPHTGWVIEHTGPEQIDYKTKEVFEAEALLLGRITYEGFAASWPQRDGEFADKMNSMPKYVVSSTIAEPLEWDNSTVVKGALAREVTRLKEQDGGPLLVAGSATLVRALIEHDLVDELRLMVFRSWSEAACERSPSHEPRSCSSSPTSRGSPPASPSTPTVPPAPPWPMTELRPSATWASTSGASG